MIELKYKLTKKNFDDYKRFYNYKSLSVKNSSYWEIHKKNIKIKFAIDSVIVSGVSGFYYPLRLNFFQNLIYKIKIIYSKFRNLKNFLLAKRCFLIDYGTAFDSIFQNKIFKGELLTNIDIGMNRIDYKKLIKNSYFKCVHDISKDFYKYFKETINDHVVKYYYWLILLYCYKATKKKMTVVEVGAGSCFLTALLINKFDANMIIVDLKETMLHSIPFVQSKFPDHLIVYPNQATKEIVNNKKHKKIIFLLPHQLHLVKSKSADLFVNTLSFKEMKKIEIQNYCDFAYRTLKKNKFFFSVNRVEKVPPQTKSIKFPTPIKFFDFPFLNKYRVIFLETCQLMRLVQLDNCLIFLGKK